MDDVDDVVLLSPDGAEIGTVAKSAVHGPDTPLHLAFSCYLLDDEGQQYGKEGHATRRANRGFRKCCNDITGPDVPEHSAAYPQQRVCCVSVGVADHARRKR